MKRFVRAQALIPAVFLAIACESDVKPVGDALAEDSTLTLAVMNARADSGVDIVEVTELGDAASTSPPLPVVEATAEPAVTAVPVATTPRSVNASPPVLKRTSPRSAAAKPVARTVSVRAAPKRTVKAGNQPRAAAPKIRNSTVVASRGWLVMPAGSDIELEAGQQICNADSGNGFEAVVAENVVMANGVIIPEGAVARGAVISGTGIQPVLTVEWITFDGRMYEVNTRVTHADAKRSRSKSYCVPDGGRIVAELTAPLRVRLTE